MKKIRCPRCSVINLEGFVSYPNCAGCGAALPAPEKETLPFWKRQLGPLVWASVLSGAILVVLLLAARALERPTPAPVQIVMLGTVPRVVRIGDVFTVALRLDVMDNPLQRGVETLHGVNLRLPREQFRRFALLTVQPPPDRTEEVGSGHYFEYAHLARGVRLRFQMRALRLGRQRIAARVRDGSQSSDSFRALVIVLPAAAG